MGARKLRKWESIFSEEDRKLAKIAGFGKRQAFGKKPALLVIDVNKSFIGSQDKSRLDAVKEFRTSCGKYAWEAMGHIVEFIKACRRNKIPIIYTTNDISLTRFSGGPDKIWGPNEKLDSESQEIAAEIKPLPEDVIIKKTRASAFFGTSLALVLNRMRIDTLFVIGTSTSGCVRATVVDALSHNFTVFVVEECTFDRFELSHLVSLWDMDMKYANVVSLKEACNYLGNITHQKFK